MAKRILILFILAALFHSCASKPAQVSDEGTDTQLGVTQEEDAQEAEQSLAELHKAQFQEQKRQLARVIAEPVPDTSNR